MRRFAGSSLTCIPNGEVGIVVVAVAKHAPLPLCPTLHMISDPHLNILKQVPRSICQGCLLYVVVSAAGNMGNTLLTAAVYTVCDVQACEPYVRHHEYRAINCLLVLVHI